MTSSGSYLYRDETRFSINFVRIWDSGPFCSDVEKGGKDRSKWTSTNSMLH